MNEKKQPWEQSRICEHCGPLDANMGCRHLYVSPVQTNHYFLLDIGKFCVRWYKLHSASGVLYDLQAFKVSGRFDWPPQDHSLMIGEEGIAHCDPDHGVSWAHLLKAFNDK